MLKKLGDTELIEYHKLYSHTSKRAIDTKINGYSTKFLYHTVRLLSECEQILVEHDIDLQKNREQLKSIRRGEWSVEQIEQYFQDKEKQLEDLYSKSTLRYKPEEDEIKELLLKCLEMHYGSLDKAITITPTIEKDIQDVLKILDKYKTYM